MFTLQTGPVLNNFVTLMCAVPMESPFKKNSILGVPVYLEGPPGIGKSSSIKFAGASLGLVVETIFPSSRMPEDFNEVLFPDMKGGVKMTCAMFQVKSLYEEGKGILFLDEGTLAVRAVQNAMMAPVWDRYIGGLRLPGAVRVVIAGNAADSVGGEVFPRALYNRIATVAVEHAAAAKYCGYLRDKVEKELGPDTFEDGPSALQHMEEAVLDNWRIALPRATEEVALFLSAHAQMLQETEESPGLEVAWCSPRSWEVASRALATYYCTKDLLRESGKPDNPIYTRGCIEALVGINAWTAFGAFLRTMRMPSMQDVLEGRWKPSAQEVDVAVYVSKNLGWHFTKMLDAKSVTEADVGYSIHLITMYCEAGLTDNAKKLVKSVQRLANEAGTQSQKSALRGVVKSFFTEADWL